MKVIIQTPEFKAKQELLDLVEEKVSKLERFNERIIDARVTLKLDKSDTRENKICEIKIAIPGNDLYVSKQAETFEEAIAFATDAIKRQVVEAKEKATP